MRVHLVDVCFALVVASWVVCASGASGAATSDAGGFSPNIPVSASDGARFSLARLGAVPGSLPPTTFGKDDLFPEDFAFGVASSAFQIEGDGGGRPRSTWDDFSDARGLGDAARRGIRHFEHVEDDIQYMARAGVRHYRLSLSWPRLQRKDGTPDEAGYAFYERMLAALRNEGIEPYVTLHHWDLPASLCRKTSAVGSTRENERNARETDCPAVDWLDPVSVSQFETYAAQAFARLGGYVRFWATLNEPKTVANLGYGSGLHAPGVISATAPLLAGHHMLLAHAAAAKTYREKFRDGAPGGAGQISLVVNADWREPSDASNGADVAAASRAMDEELGWFADPLYFGDYPESVKARYGADLPAFTEAQKRSLKGSTDYFALNHYASAYVAAAALSPANSFLGRPMDWTERDVNARGEAIGPTGTCAWLKQAPFGLRKTLALVKARYGRPKTYVTENGLCSGPGPGAPAASALDDTERVAYVSGYLKAALDAIAMDGADVRGYFAWTFFDNFEWADGDAQRFGMVHVDHAGEFGGARGARVPKKSLAAYREFMIGKHSTHGENDDGRASMGRRTVGSVSSPRLRDDALDGNVYRPFAWEGDGDAAASSARRNAADLVGPDLSTLGASPLGRRGGPTTAAAVPSRIGASWTEYPPGSADDYEREITKAEQARFALAAAVEALAEAEHPRGSEAASTLEMGRETLAREDDDRPSAETLLAQAERVLAVAEAASRGADAPAGADLATSSAAGDENVSGDAAGDAAAMASAANRGGAAAFDGSGSTWSPLRPRRVSAAAVTLGPVWMATFVGVVFGLFLIAIQMSCNLMRKGKRGCGTNEGEVRSLVAVAKTGARGEAGDTRNYGGTPAKTV